ncbi:hypothetical protein J437_LFUL004443 [Ladona fulva]|uniref:Craniofacial development protein 1 n=1 Tax=Ladona fulva TaxID=123851 RepID=A0A8K0JZW7_LADFU|nr:hypothetical protein J437_LFUL004443 [Ladona fulva]
MSSSGSDSGDEDYVPSEGEAPSEAESEGEEEEFCNKEEGEENVAKGRKRGKKRERNHSAQEDNEEATVEDEKPGDIKKKSDSLWSDFLKQVSPSENEGGSEKPKSEKEKQVVTEVYEFAGEKVTVKKKVDSETETKKSMTVSVESEDSKEEEEEEVSKDAEKSIEVKQVAARKSTLGLSANSHAISKPKFGGSILSSALDKLGKKNKLSTLEKSKLDWESYKDKEGISEEISSFNRGKKGFLEKRDFLERTDLKQYELEKQLRNTQRSKR